MSADLVIEAPRTRLAIGSADTGTGSGQDVSTYPGRTAVPAPRAGQHAAPHLAPESLPGWRALLESHWRARLERVTELSLAYHDAEEAHHSQATLDERPSAIRGASQVVGENTDHTLAIGSHGSIMPIPR